VRSQSLPPIRDDYTDLAECVSRVSRDTLTLLFARTLIEFCRCRQATLLLCSADFRNEMRDIVVGMCKCNRCDMVCDALVSSLQCAAPTLTASLLTLCEHEQYNHLFSGQLQAAQTFRLHYAAECPSRTWICCVSLSTPTQPRRSNHDYSLASKPASVNAGA
jgi:hypothetical protein